MCTPRTDKLGPDSSFEHFRIGAADVVCFQLLGLDRLALASLTPAHTSNRCGGNRRQGKENQSRGCGGFDKRRIGTDNCPSCCMLKKFCSAQHVLGRGSLNVEGICILTSVDIAPACIQSGHDLALNATTKFTNLQQRNRHDGLVQNLGQSFYRSKANSQAGERARAGSYRKGSNVVLRESVM